MAELKFQIPDERMSELVDAWGSEWLDKVPDPDNPGDMIDNPQTKQQFAKQQIRRTIVDRVKYHQTQQMEDFPIT